MTAATSAAGAAGEDAAALQDGVAAAAQRGVEAGLAGRGRVP